jgi:hypothetical protein
MSKIFCFGDSWAYGSELKKNEEPFVHWISLELRLPYVNFGKAGNSLGIILHDIVENIHLMNESDIVFVIIPPDLRWYDQNKTFGFYAINSYEKRFYKWIGEKTLEWFTYHHAIFIYTIQKILNDINCRYVLAHDFGKLEIDKYNLKIDKSKFASKKSLHALLTNMDDIELKDLFHGIRSEDCPGIFFEGCSYGHPNELGHKLIAKILLHKLKNI